MNSSCRFCTESMSFYRRLSANSAVLTGKVRMNVLSYEPAERMQRYLDVHHLSVSGIVPISGTGLPPLGTPTLFIVDRDGRVVHSWRGLLGPQEEAIVMQRLSQASVRSRKD